MRMPKVSIAMNLLAYPQFLHLQKWGCYNSNVNIKSIWCLFSPPCLDGFRPLKTKIIFQTFMCCFHVSFQRVIHNHHISSPLYLWGGNPKESPNQSSFHRTFCYNVGFHRTWIIKFLPLANSNQAALQRKQKDKNIFSAQQNKLLIEGKKRHVSITPFSFHSRCFFPWQNVWQGKKKSSWIGLSVNHPQPIKSPKVVFFVGSGGNGLARGAREIVARIAAGAVIDGLRKLWIWNWKISLSIDFLWKIYFRRTMMSTYIHWYTLV